MKRIIITLCPILCLGLAAGAQDMYYAELLSKNSYYGTARSIALGNAMTALGGDQGSYVINPAGSAVSSYGQFSITPGVVISSADACYYPLGTGSGSQCSTTRPRFYLPEVAASVVWNTGREYGLKRMAFGFAVSGTSNYSRYVSGGGVNSGTSMLGSIAAAAKGTDPDNFSGSMYASYWANQFGSYGDSDWNYAGSNQRIDKNDTYVYVPGTLNQSAVYNTQGSKSDVILNFGMDFSDIFYAGINVGFPSLNYSRYESFYEAAADPTQFPVNFRESQISTVTTNYLNSTNQYRLSTRANGIYAKIGVLWTPLDGLRVGAAFRTPTALSIYENWQYSAASSYEASKFNSTASSTPGNYSYTLRTPYSANAGVAYTFGGLALVSVDYELEDFSSMRYRSGGMDDSASSKWYGVNETNRLFCGLSHNLRIGAEFKLAEAFAIRAGYNICTSPERYYTDADGKQIYAENYLDSSGMPKALVLNDPKYFNANTRALSLGFGYSSPGSFYIDIAGRLTHNPLIQSYRPYYYGSYDALDKDGKSLGFDAPGMTIDHKLWDVVLTFGWRF